MGALRIQGGASTQIGHFLPAYMLTYKFSIRTKQWTNQLTCEHPCINPSLLLMAEMGNEVGGPGTNLESKSLLPKYFHGRIAEVRLFDGTFSVLMHQSSIEYVQGV